MCACIPKRLKIFIRKQIQVQRTICGQVQTLFVSKAFATDADKPKTHETAEKWASRGRYDYEKREYIDKDYTVVDRDNEPFDGLCIYDIDIRSEGGRAYKVQTKEGWAFDCREDCILDTIIEEGIGAGGLMKGKFIWAKDGSQMKITRVGSELYQKALKQDKKEAKGRIKNKDLEVGGVYTTLGGNVAQIYLGTEAGKLKFADIWWNKNWVEEKRKRYTKYQEDLKAWEASEPLEIKDTWWNRRYTDTNRRAWGYRPRNPLPTHSQLRKSHSFVEKIGQLTQEELEELVLSYLDKAS